MATQNNGFTFNISGNGTCNINQATEKGNYEFAVIKANNRLAAIDASYAHLTGVVAIASSIISDPEYEEDSHLLSLVQAIILNTNIVLDMQNCITAN